jgi:hypothetical protein
MRLDSNNKAAAVKGSAYYCSKDPTHKTEMVPLGAMIDNVALVQKGGENGDANTYLVTKEFISSIDFRRPGYMKGDVNDLYDKNKNKISYFGTDKTIELSGKNVKALPVSGSNQGGTPSKFTDERMGGNIFTIDSITFGMEICLDHLYNTLQQGGAHHIQVQLIPSAGLNIGHKDCVANGIVFNVDGARGDTDLQLNVGVNPQVAAAASYDFSASRTYFPDSGKVVIYPPQALPWPTDVRSFTGVVTHKPLPKPPVPRKPLPPIPPPKVNN